MSSSLLLALSPVPPLTADQLAALDPEASRARENALRADLYRLRAERPGSGVCADAYNRLAGECAAMGHPLGALREQSRDEAERFFAKTVPGPDGHVYWIGRKSFFRNDGLQRQPARWWWEHRSGVPLARTDEIGPECGEKGCINPEHYRAIPRSERRLRFTEARMLGGLQVLALRLGRPPTSKDWQNARMQPVTAVFTARFGSWARALAAAGFPGYRSATQAWKPEECLAAIRYVHKQMGRWPYADDFDRYADSLRAQGLPSSQSTVYRVFGSWPEAIRQAQSQKAERPI